jgi:WD40 repeat protein
VWRVAFSPDGSQFATTSNDGKLRLRSREGTLLHTLDPWPCRVAYSSDGALIATLIGHQAALWGVAF